jgi:hypothetical protein
LLPDRSGLIGLSKVRRPVEMLENGFSIEKGDPAEG